MTIEYLWLCGCGFGPFQRSTQIASVAVKYDDPVSIQMISLVSRCIAGSLICYVLTRGSRLGLNYREMKYQFVGVTT